MDDADPVVVVCVAPLAEHHRSQAERGDLEAGMSEISIVHAATPVLKSRSGRERLFIITRCQGAVRRRRRGGGQRSGEDLAGTEGRFRRADLFYGIR